MGNDWVKISMQRHSTVVRRMTRKLQISAEAQEMIKKRVEFFRDNIERDWKSGKLNDEDIENADETYFIIKFENGKHWVSEAIRRSSTQMSHLGAKE